VLDLPVARLRQVVAAILDRRRERLRFDLRVVEWQTRRLAEVIASTVPAKPGTRHPLQGLIDQIRILPEEDDGVGEESEGREPSRGSAERFAALFGRVMDAAGRSDPVADRGVAAQGERSG
jgi:hypothetical protein